MDLYSCGVRQQRALIVISGGYQTFRKQLDLAVQWDIQTN